MKLKRFSIRTLLILTALVAVICAIPFQRANQQKRGREWVASQRGHVMYRHGYDEDSRRYEGSTDLKVPRFLVKLLGIDMFNPIESVILDCETVSDLEPIVNLQSLKQLVINIEVADDLDFSPLAKLPHLETVHLTRWSAVSREQEDRLRELLPTVQFEVERRGR